MKRYGLVNVAQVDRFKFCPYCGDESVIPYEGDFEGMFYCLNPSCDEFFEYQLISEIKARYPDKFEELIGEL
jgi:hypothetical protein